MILQIILLMTFESFFSRHQNGLETSIKGGDFMFDSVQLLYYKCYKINFERAGSYIYSSDWTKKSDNKPQK